MQIKMTLIFNLIPVTEIFYIKDNKWVDLAVDEEDPVLQRGR